MNYLYTACNRLDEPHAYMYSPCGGEAFLQSYVKDRIERVLCLSTSTGTGCSTAEVRAHAVLRKLLVVEGDFPIAKLAELLSKPVVITETDSSNVVFPANCPNDESVNTAALLNALLYSFLKHSVENENGSVALQWVDRLLQRFEVSKKLHSRYLPGFRKGEGVNDDVSLYLMFSLVLALAYAHRQQLQYLSTLLKINDLLLSLSSKAYAGCSGCYALVLAVAVEIHAVSQLSEKQGVSLNVA